MLTNSNHQVDKLALQARIMKNGQMRKLRDMAEKLLDFDARVRKLEGPRRRAPLERHCPLRNDLDGGHRDVTTV